MAQSSLVNYCFDDFEHYTSCRDTSIYNSLYHGASM